MIGKKLNHRTPYVTLTRKNSENNMVCQKSICCLKQNICQTINDFAKNKISNELRQK